MSTKRVAFGILIGWLLVLLGTRLCIRVSKADARKSTDSHYRAEIIEQGMPSKIKWGPEARKTYVRHIEQNGPTRSYRIVEMRAQVTGRPTTCVVETKRNNRSFSESLRFYGEQCLMFEAVPLP